MEREVMGRKGERKEGRESRWKHTKDRDGVVANREATMGVWAHLSSTLRKHK